MTHHFQIKAALVSVGIALLAATSGCSSDNSQSALDGMSGGVNATTIDVPDSAHVAAPSTAIAQLLPARNGSGTTVRPALTGDPMAMTQEQLVAAGYPLRPDPILKPEAHKAWLNKVATPLTLVDPGLVLVPDHRGTTIPPTTTGTSANWSATEMDAATSGTFTEVAGSWTVPNVACCFPQSVYSATWVGIDGDGLSDLLQAGTEQDVNAAGTASYYPWIEYLPFDPYEVAVSGVTIHPGDFVEVELFIGDSTGGQNASGAYAWFQIANITTSVGTGWFSRHYPTSSSYFHGTEAEAVVERPLVSGSFPWLAHYGSTGIIGFGADNSTKTIGTAATYKQITMVDSTTGDTLSTASADTTLNTSNFVWSNYH